MHLPTTGNRTVARLRSAHLVSPLARVRAGLAARARALRDDGESGAQVMEYAMLGSAGAALVALIIAIVTSGPVREALVSFVLALFQSVIPG